MTTPTSRSLWQLFEPIHAVTYFDPAADEPMRALGVGSFWARYFLKRSAPLGAVGPAAVTSAFFVFHPRRAAAVLPHAWHDVSPERVLVARAEGARLALDGIATDDHWQRVADLLWPVARRADCAGLVLAAAEQALERPDDPVVAAWQAMTTLREHRGSAHVAVLVAHGVGPVEAMQLKVAAGESVADDLRLGRAWSEAAWADGLAALRRRGWLEGDALTAAGRAARDEIETATDDIADRPWPDRAERARAQDLLAPLAAAVWSTGHLPERNPVGVTRAREMGRIER